MEGTEGRSHCLGVTILCVCVCANGSMCAAVLHIHSLCKSFCSKTVTSYGTIPQSIHVLASLYLFPCFSSHFISHRPHFGVSYRFKMIIASGKKCTNKYNSSIMCVYCSFVWVYCSELEVLVVLFLGHIIKWFGLCPIAARVSKAELSRGVLPVPFTVLIHA